MTISLAAAFLITYIISFISVKKEIKGQIFYFKIG